MCIYLICIFFPRQFRTIDSNSMHLPFQLLLALLTLLVLGCEQQQKAPATTDSAAMTPKPVHHRVIDSVDRKAQRDTTPKTEATEKVYRAEVDTTIDPSEEEISGCSLGCAVGWTVRASSTLPSQGGNSYDVSKLDDGIGGTAWVEGAPGDGVGESITYRFPRKDFNAGGETESVGFWGLTVFNGYHKSARNWRENARAKKLRLYHNNRPLFTIELQDIMRLQSVGFPDFQLKPDDSVRIEIVEIYPGERYQDLAISELTPMGAH